MGGGPEEAVMKPKDVLILGAGLAGLSAAFHLRDLDLAWAGTVYHGL